MANILKTIIENDKGEIRRLEKMADKGFQIRRPNGCFDRWPIKKKQLNLKNVIKWRITGFIALWKSIRLSVKVPNVS